jgi:S-adenosylmethionine:tRNA ribosyltransferase-isomerase
MNPATPLRPASAPRDARDDTRLLVVDRHGRGVQDLGVADLVDQLRPGDLLIVNDAATLPGSLRARRPGHDEVLELRLTGPLDGELATAALLGAGDWRSPTERRPAPPALAVGDRLLLLAPGPEGTCPGRHVPDDSHGRGRRPARPAAAHDPLRPRRRRAVGRALPASAAPCSTRICAPRSTCGRCRPPSPGGPGPPRCRPPVVPSPGRPCSPCAPAASRSPPSPTPPASAPPATPPSTPCSRCPSATSCPPPPSPRSPAPAPRRGRVIAAGTTVVRALEGCLAERGELLPGPGVTALRLHAGFTPARRRRPPHRHARPQREPLSPAPRLRRRGRAARRVAPRRRRRLPAARVRRRHPAATDLTQETGTHITRPRRNTPITTKKKRAAPAKETALGTPSQLKSRPKAASRPYRSCGRTVLRLLLLVRSMAAPRSS